MLKGRSITLYRYIISPQVAAIVHSNYWQVALASIYVCMYICTLSKSQVSEAQHARCTISPSYMMSVVLLSLSHGRARSKL